MATRIEVLMSDITKMPQVEAIVNAAKETLLGGGGVDGAIHRAAGPKLLEECRTLHGCNPGEAKITAAYNLPNRYVIHTVGPRWYGGANHEAEILGNAYRNSLELAASKGIRSIAFPSISTGIFGYPIDQAAQVAVGVVLGFVKENPEAFDVICWAMRDDKNIRLYKAAIEAAMKAER